MIARFRARPIPVLFGLLTLCLGGVWTSCALRAPPPFPTARIVAVRDAETVSLERDGKRWDFHLADIRANGLFASGGVYGCFGEAARDFAVGTLSGSTVRVVATGSGSASGSILLGSGTATYNEALVRAGFAVRDYLGSGNVFETLGAAEDDARLNKRGIWGTCPSTPPALSEDGVPIRMENPAPLPSENLPVPEAIAPAKKTPAAPAETAKIVKSPTKKKAEPFVRPDRCPAKAPTCSKMRSCEEARFYLDVCRFSRLDKDGDGIPCESLCEK